MTLIIKRKNDEHATNNNHKVFKVSKFQRKSRSVATLLYWKDSPTKIAKVLPIGYIEWTTYYTSCGNIPRGFAT